MTFLYITGGIIAVGLIALLFILVTTRDIRKSFEDEENERGKFRHP